MKHNVDYKTIGNWLPVLIVISLTFCGGMLALLTGTLEMSASALSIPLSMPTDGFIFLLLSIILLYIVFDNLPRLERLRTAASKDGLDTRLNALTQALNDAGQTIDSIEHEILSRQALVDKLQAQKTLAEKAITLNKEQVEAITALLNQEISKQSKADARREFLKDMAFFIAGIIVTVFLGQLGIGR